MDNVSKITGGIIIKCETDTSLNRVIHPLIIVKKGDLEEQKL